MTTRTAGCGLGGLVGTALTILLSNQVCAGHAGSDGASGPHCQPTYGRDPGRPTTSLQPASAALGVPARGPGAPLAPEHQLQVSKRGGSHPHAKPSVHHWPAIVPSRRRSKRCCGMGSLSPTGPGPAP
ncbi:hypothetical protein PGIGA_G00233450 [Pangasianodon gigas]|uniref:Uncharacterized protein n=1 Tax=Pangasianodon gigas TaxID=30993 RepID=A0ACC5WNE2_PANGG|nr:hypothetical protein [Pangasianodon gigas]